MRAVQAETGRIWSVDYSERFEVPSVTLAEALVRDGAIGRVVQTVGLGPPSPEPGDAARLVFRPRRLWRYPDRYRQPPDRPVPAFHRVEDAEITHAAVENYAHPGDPGLQDFGEIALRSDHGRGYIRVDWFTPDALPNWGDGRLTILGTEGYIELRKYVDVGGRAGTDTLILANGERCEAIDARDAGLPYFARIITDVQDSTETAMSQAHCFKVMELALQAQRIAEGLA
jgi:predicted dehydrogenase